MGTDNKEQIKIKLKELLGLIKEETLEESKDIREDILATIDGLKDKLDKGRKKVDINQGKIQDNIDDLMKDLEAKALKVQYTVLEKYSQGVDKKDEQVVKTADALVEAINKAKKALTRE